MALENEIKSIEENLSKSTIRAEQFGQEYQAKAAELSTIQARITEVDMQLTAQRREMLTVSQSETHLDARFQSLNEKVREQTERFRDFAPGFARID